MLTEAEIKGTKYAAGGKTVWATGMDGYDKAEYLRRFVPGLFTQVPTTPVGKVTSQGKVDPGGAGMPIIIDGVTQSVTQGVKKAARTVVSAVQSVVPTVEVDTSSGQPVEKKQLYSMIDDVLMPMMPTAGALSGDDGEIIPFEIKRVVLYGGLFVAGLALLKVIMGNGGSRKGGK